MPAVEPYLERLIAGGVRLRADPQALAYPDAGPPPAPAAALRRPLDVPGMGPLLECCDPQHAADAATLFLARVLAERIVLTDVERAWDLGCGTGVLTAALAHHGVPAVRGSDVSEQAVRLARETLAGAGLDADLRVGSLLAPFAGEPPEELLVTNLPHKPCAPDAPEVDGPFAGVDGDAHYDALRRALLRRGVTSRVLLFLHSLPHPGLLLRWSASFDLRLVGWYRRFLGEAELPHLRKVYRRRHAQGLSYLGEEQGREYLVGSAFEIIGP